MFDYDIMVCNKLKHRRIQELKLREPRSSTEGTSWVEAPKAPKGVECGDPSRHPLPQREGSGSLHRKLF